MYLTAFEHGVINNNQICKFFLKILMRFCNSLKKFIKHNSCMHLQLFVYKEVKKNFHILIELKTENFNHFFASRFVIHLKGTLKYIKDTTCMHCQLLIKKYTIFFISSIEPKWKNLIIYFAWNFVIELLKSHSNFVENKNPFSIRFICWFVILLWFYMKYGPPIY